MFLKAFEFDEGLTTTVSSTGFAAFATFAAFCPASFPADLRFPIVICDEIQSLSCMQQNDQAVAVFGNS